MGKSKLKPKELHFLKTKGNFDIAAICREANIILRSQLVTKGELLQYICNALETPEVIDTDNRFKTLTQHLKAKNITSVDSKSNELHGEVSLHKPLSYTIYGADGIEPGAIEQMENAMSLPVTLAGSLMADAHEGYGLPIGGVLATTGNVIIPYAVGVDIACRMCMSVFPIKPEILGTKSETLSQILLRTTIFGVGSKNKNHIDTSLFDKKEWSATKVIKQLRDLAYSQLGTSGGGNHFVEWGELHITEFDPLLGFEPGKYLALLSHSGSRGFGSEIALYYSKLAMEKVRLPGKARHLAWLDLNSQEGQEYWLAMNLAGEYASANHHEIHAKVARELNVRPIRMIENHHNFAWFESLPDGRKAIVHRKGATPAHPNSLGIIPGSMVHPAFVIKGKGNPASLSSASHGAGRKMSRSKALQTFTQADLNYILEKWGVELIGAGLDEVPMAYKDIDAVMAYQSDLVGVLAKFYPKIVRMANPERKHRWE
ncbi:MAG TPA: RtcB family protein [Tenuifilum sp.]|nr:RtcB family protein [Tenuifilum sp.]